MDSWESVKDKLGVREVDLLLSEAKLGNIGKKTLYDIARLLGGSVLGGHKLRTEKRLRVGQLPSGIERYPHRLGK